jgi:hypothetical protein
MSAMRSIYVTVVSYEYALLAISLVHALSSAGKKCALYCIDDRGADLLEEVLPKSCVVFRPADYQDAKLVEIRKNRSDSEYCWTCKSVALEHILTQMPELDWAIYLDSDMMIFGDPDKALPTSSDAHVLLTPHRPSTPHFESFMQQAGHFNAGYIAFRASKDGLKALRWWREKCEESCSVRPDAQGYADQRYLDEFSELFNGVTLSENLGVNAAPWNISGKRITKKSDSVFIDNDELLIYHMQGFKKIGFGFYDLYSGELNLPASVRDFIYGPYIRHLERCSLLLSSDYAGPRMHSHSRSTRAALREVKRKFQGLSNVYRQRVEKG